MPQSSKSNQLARIAWGALLWFPVTVAMILWLRSYYYSMFLTFDSKTCVDPSGHAVAQEETLNWLRLTRERLTLKRYQYQLESMHGIVYIELGSTTWSFDGPKQDFSLRWDTPVFLPVGRHLSLYSGDYLYPSSMFGVGWKTSGDKWSLNWRRQTFNGGPFQTSVFQIQIPYWLIFGFAAAISCYMWRRWRNWQGRGFFVTPTAMTSPPSTSQSPPPISSPPPPNPAASATRLVPANFADAARPACR